MEIKFEIGKEYKINFKNGKEAGTLIFNSFENFKDYSFGVNQQMRGYAVFNGKKVQVAILGHNNVLKSAMIINGNNRYDLVTA